MNVNNSGHFARTELLLGEPAMNKLAATRVAIFGVGGVGGYALEALVRSGVGAIDVIDFDTVSESNINRHLPEEKALCIFYHGSYESIPTARDKILAFAKENNIPLKGSCRHIYLEGPPQHKDPNKFITQIAVLIQ